MEIKPIQIKQVAPISVKPVQVAPIASPVKVQTEAKPEEVFGQLFGGAPTPEEKNDVVEDIKETAKAAVDKAVNNMVDKAKKSKESEEEPKETKGKKTEKKKYKGPREVKVYGMTLWTEEDPDVSLDDIRKKIVEEYHYPEFSASRTEMSFDDKTGIIVPLIKFEKKG